MQYPRDSAAFDGRRRSFVFARAEILLWGMTDHNLDQLRRAIDAFNRRQKAAFDGLLSSDAEIVPVRAALEGTTPRASDAGSQCCEVGEETWGSHRSAVGEIRNVGDFALALGRIRGRGRDSGITDRSPR
jgi:hypothetical protein